MTLEVAWAAGFIDGEGHLGINRVADRRVNGGRSPRLHPRVIVGQVNREPLERLQKLFGCGLYARSRRAMAEHHRTCWVWEASGASAAGLVLRATLPLLTVKAPEALVVLELCERVASWKRGQLLTAEEMAARNAIAERLVAVKATGRGAPAQVV